MPRTDGSTHGTPRNECAENIQYKHNESVAEVLDATLPHGVFFNIVVTDGGGVTINWTAGTVHTPGKHIIHTDAGTAEGSDGVNFLYWDLTTRAVVLNTSEPVFADDVLIAEIGVQDGDIWFIHSDPLTRDLVTDIAEGLSAVFDTTVSEGLVITEDADGTNSHDVSLEAGTYFVDLHEKHDVAALNTRTVNMVRWFHTAGVWDHDTDAEIDVAFYDDGTDKAAVGVNKWYRGMWLVSETAVHWIYPQTEYNAEGQAIAGVVPPIPPGLVRLPRSTSYVFQANEGAMSALGTDNWIDERIIAGGGGVSPTTGGAPVAGEYVVVAGHASLTQERVLTAGNSLGLTDGGANGNMTVGVLDGGVDTTQLADDAVTYAKLQNVTSGRILGRFIAGDADAQELTPTQVRAMLGVEPGEFEVTLLAAGAGVVV